MVTSRSRVNNCGEWWEVREEATEIVDKLRELDDENWMCLTDCVTGDDIWFQVCGITCVASSQSEEDDGIAEDFVSMLDELSGPSVGRPRLREARARRRGDL